MIKKIFFYIVILSMILSVFPMAFFTSTPVLAVDAWYNVDWLMRKSFVIDKDKLSTTVTNFPVLISLASDSALADHAQDDADDILFTNSSGTKLDAELEYFDGGTGQLICWVEVDSVSSSSDTTIYMYYNHSDVASQWNTNGTWNTNYKSVWHNTGSSTTIADSTSSVFTLTKEGATEPTEVTGKIYKAQDYDGSNDQAGKTTSTSVLDISSAFTLEAWIQGSAQTGSDYFVFANRDPDNGYYYGWYLQGSNTSTRTLNGAMYNDKGGAFISGGTLTNDAWYHAMFIYDSTITDGEQEIYVNGSKIGASQNTVGSLAITSGAVAQGELGNSGYNFHGLLDEVRVSNSNRGAGWALASYNSQNSPSTFYTLGSEQAAPDAPTNVAASDGTYVDKVVVTWTKSAGATGYKVYEGSSLIATLGDVATYDDTAAGAPTITAGTAAATDGTDIGYVTLSVSGEAGNNGASRTYKVKATSDYGESPDSSIDTGYRGTTTLTYQWYSSTTDTDGLVIFNSTPAGGIWTVPAGVTSVDYLVIGGGGGGASGGGGAGGFLEGAGKSLTPGSDVTVTVGSGGEGQAISTIGSNGTSSVFDSITALGGGGGGKHDNNAAAGASGGGGGNSDVYGVYPYGGATTDAAQGHAGGNTTYRLPPYPSSGGGGAGAAGSEGAGAGGTGGAGAYSSITGTSVGYAGGGGGTNENNVGGPASSGGGAGNYTLGNNGSANTGGGGGGSYIHGGNGGSGVVIINKVYPSLSGATTDPYNDTTAPANGEGRYYKCTISMTGASSVTTTANRGYRNANAPDAPTDVTASDGAYTDKVLVSWTKSSGATGYKIYEGSNLITTLGDVNSYNDTAAGVPSITAGTAAASDGTASYVTLSVSSETGNNGSSRTYKLKAINSNGESVDSATDTGYRGPTTLTYIWQRSAADSDADYSTIAGGTTDPYNDTGSPSDGSGRYFRALISMTDSSSDYTIANRGYRTTAPVVSSDAVATNIADTTMTADGDLTSDSGEACTKIGIVYSSVTNPPTVGGASCSTKETTGGSYTTGQSISESITGLTAGTTYYWRAYAYNSSGYGYGSTRTQLMKPSFPTTVSATDGTYSNKVVITWTKPTGATGYKVYEGSNLLATLGDVTTYDDTAAPAPTITAGTAAATDGSATYVTLSVSGESGSNGTTRTYKVVATNPTGYSADSTTDTGYRGISSLNYQWYASAADSDASYSIITLGTTDPYDYTAAPVDGSGRYFKVAISALGVSENTTAANRGYRSSTPVFVTSAATLVTESTATLNGEITDMKGEGTITVTFEYGTTAYYGSSTSNDIRSGTGIFSSNIAGLTSGTLYHYRIKATYGGGTTTDYTADATFTTTLVGSLSPPDLLQIINVTAYKDYAAVGDRLFVIVYKIIYNAGDPTADVTDYFSIDIRDNGVVKAKTSPVMWGYRVASIYQNAASALPWGESYSVKIYGLTTKFGTNPPFDTFVMTDGDWMATTLTDKNLLVTTIRDTATNIGTYYAVALTEYTISGVVLSSTNVLLDNTVISGAEIFTKAISGLRDNVYQVFSVSSSDLGRSTDSPHPLTLKTESTIDARWGTGAEANLDTLGSSLLAGVAGKDLYLLIWVILIIIVAFALFTTGSPILSGVGALIMAVFGAFMGADLWVILGIGGMLLAFLVFYDYLRSG